MRERLAILAVMLSLTGCGFAEDEKLVGPYRIVAVDIEPQRALCWTYEDTNDCLGNDLPGPMLYAAGFDERNIVIAIHPYLDDGKNPASKTSRFFYIVRNLSKESRLKTGGTILPYEAMKGPFDQNAFEAEKARLHLPDFSRYFSES